MAYHGQCYSFKVARHLGSAGGEETLDRPLIKFTRDEDLVADRDRLVCDLLEFFRIPLERMTTFTPLRVTATNA